MSYEVEPGGYLLDEENFGEHSIELINGEKNGSVWLIVDNKKFLVKKPILRVKLSTTSPETIKNISQSRRKKTVESDVSLTSPPHPYRQKSVDGDGQRRRGIFLNERKV